MIAVESNLSSVSVGNCSPLPTARSSNMETDGRSCEVVVKEEQQAGKQHPEQPLSIFDLPRELIENVLYHMHYTDIESLRQVSKAGSQVILLEDVKNSRLQWGARLWAFERGDYAEKQRTRPQWAALSLEQNITHSAMSTYIGAHPVSLFNCYSCLRTLQKKYFTDRQTKGSRCYGHEDAKMRFCTTCGVKKSIWSLGTVLKIAHRSYVLCRGCQSLQKGEPCYRKYGCCSQECQDKVKAPSKLDTELDLLLRQTTHEVERMALADSKPAETASITIAVTRAGRCLRCWSIDHTERPVEGDSKRNLCRECGSIERSTLYSTPTLTDGKGTDTSDQHA